MGRTAAIILCGGRSSRMGQSKADLVLAGESLLDRTIHLAATVADPIILAAAAEQNLPRISRPVHVVRDRQPFGGPLTAFGQALEALPQNCAVTFLLGCDLPFLNVEFLHRLAESRMDADAVVPWVNGTWHPLSALYRREVQAPAARVIAAGGRRMLDLLEVISVRRLDESELRMVDPDRRALRNVNTPQDFAAALRELSPENTVNSP
jgi:molybdopterin-guanine dinucleotide biosynthesis protein A